MKLHPEDPRLTAYLLGELGTEEAAAVENTIAADPALQSVLREMESVREVLAHTLTPASHALLPSQRAGILQAARQADRSAKPASRLSFPTKWKPWLIPFAAAAAVILTVFLISRIPARRNLSAGNPPTPPPVKGVQADSPKIPVQAPIPTPAPSPAETVKVVPNETPVIPAPAHHFEVPGSSQSVTVAERPTLELPILPAQPALQGISQAVRTERKLPAHESVRLEEILNSFPIRLNGVTSIARVAKQAWHPDSRDEGMTVHAATVTTEVMACPWKPSATLLLISIRGNATNDCDAKVIFHPDAAAVSRYRLLGHLPVDGIPPGNIPTRIAAKSTTTLVIEIEPSTATGELGSIEWAVNGEPAPTIRFSRSGDTEPSDDARFAALACTYAQWLAGEQTGIIDAALLSALAREIASSSLPAERTDFLELINESLRL